MYQQRTKEIMTDKTFIGEGHYRDENGTEFMSIWSFKKAFNVGSNNRDQNYEDAIALGSANKFWGAFNQSQYFKEGWMFEVSALNSFYSI